METPSQRQQNLALELSTHFREPSLSMRTLLLGFLLGGACALRATVGSRASAARAPSMRAGVAAMQSRWSDPILDESIPDPIYDQDSPYKGRVPYGFSDNAEKLNGRAAMMGILGLMVHEKINELSYYNEPLQVDLPFIGVL